jgi:hypothetical protein
LAIKVVDQTTNDPWVVPKATLLYPLGMWVFFGSLFTFSNFDRLDIYNETSVTLADLRWELESKYRFENQSFYDLVMLIRSECLRIP